MYHRYKNLLYVYLEKSSVCMIWFQHAVKKPSMVKIQGRILGGRGGPPRTHPKILRETIVFTKMENLLWLTPSNHHIPKNDLPNKFSQGNKSLCASRTLFQYNCSN